MRARWLARGLCIKCGNNPAKPGSQKCKPCTDSQREANVRYRKKLRLKAIDRYGGKCVCCGESTPEFLTFDHKDNDGAEHRKMIGEGGMPLLRWIVKNDYPDPLQLHCWNCNAAKSLYGVCPHQKVAAC